MSEPLWRPRVFIETPEEAPPVDSEGAWQSFDGEENAWLRPVADGAVLIEAAEHDAYCQMVEDTLGNFFRNPAKVGEAAAAVLNAAVRRYGTNGGEGTT